MAAKYSMDRTTEKECEDIGSSIDQDTSADVIDTDQSVYRTSKECANEIRIVLLGRTGNGKSATGNSIMGQDYFRSMYHPQSVTQICCRGETERGDKKVIIVDTPGLFDTKNVSNETRKEIVKCIGVSAPGAHAIIYVLSLKNRLTEEEINTFVEIKSMFGEELFNYVVFLFTGKDELAGKQMTFESFLSLMPDFFQKVLKKCNNRSIAFSNHPYIPDREKKQQIDNLFSVVEGITKKANGKYFSNHMIKETELLIEEELSKLFLAARKSASPVDDDTLRTQLRAKIRDDILTDDELIKRLLRIFRVIHCSIL
ncbi:GTPase IMAP family member 7-like [Mytilus galloprovincialis]|uniref:GTPase IMAP family member 7-like n=1 Tax=Mytilus galloprovincialis TaxID=29158 RepID=UPI003F7C93D4